MKRRLSLLLALSLTPALAVAQKKAQPAAATAASATDPVIVSAGGISVRKSEFEAALASLPPQMQQQAQGEARRQFAEEYLRMRVLAAKGAAAGVQNDPDVARQLRMTRDNVIANAMIARIGKTITVSDADLRKLYDANQSQYELVRARHILIAFKGSPAAQQGKKELSDAEAKAKADSIRAQLAAGADFAELAKKESDDTGSGANGGDLGAFRHGQMVPQFDSAAFALKVGEISPVVRTQFGYHVLKVESRAKEEFDDVKPDLERAEKQKRLQAAIDSLNGAVKPVFNPAYFATEK